MSDNSASWSEALRLNVVAASLIPIAGTHAVTPLDPLDIVVVQNDQPPLDIIIFKLWALTPDASETRATIVQLIRAALV